MAARRSTLPDFRAARRLVSNAEFLAFVEAGGYRDESLWTEEGRGWLHYTKARHPRFWVERDGEYRQRNLLEEIDLPLDWPVEVNCLEARSLLLAGWPGRRARTCCCPPRPTGTPCTTTRSPPRTAALESISPPGRGPGQHQPREVRLAPAR